MTVDEIQDLKHGVEYDLHMNSGVVYRGWYVYDIKCGYFTRAKDSQLHGFIYVEAISHIVPSSSSH